MIWYPGKRIWTPPGLDSRIGTPGSMSGGMQSLSGVETGKYGAASNGLLNNLVAYYSLDNVNDATGRGNTLTNNGTSTFVTSIIPNGVNLVRASSQFLSRTAGTGATLTDLDLGTTSKTLSAWVKLTSTGNNMGIVANDDNNFTDFVLYVPSAANSIELAIQKQGNAAVSTSLSFTWSTGVWVFIVFYYDPANTLQKVRVNDATEATTANTLGGATNGTRTFFIGSRGNAFGNYNMDGVIDEVGVWNAVLTSAQITALYNAGSGLAFGSFTT